MHHIWDKYLFVAKWIVFVFVILLSPYAFIRVNGLDFNISGAKVEIFWDNLLNTIAI